MSLGYFPGCALEGTAREYGESVKLIFAVLGEKLVEIPDWNCCGATAAHSINRMLSLALPARAIAIAQREGLSKILAPCAACSQRLIVVNHELSEDAELRAKIEDIIKMKLSDTVEILNMIQGLLYVGIDEIRARVQRKFEGIRFACYYGCLLLRPPKILDFDDPENPDSMERIVEGIGGETVDWPYKNECCGGGFTLSASPIVERLSNDVLSSAKAEGADALVVACPMCHANLDMKQRDIEKRYKKKYNLPVYYLSELVGLALELKPGRLGINRHFVPAEKLLCQE